ncbi:uncharacterized [Tachysurus ichikawai]
MGSAVLTVTTSLMFNVLIRFRASVKHEIVGRRRLVFLLCSVIDMDPSAPEQLPVTLHSTDRCCCFTHQGQKLCKTTVISFQCFQCLPYCNSVYRKSQFSQRTASF